MSFPRPALLSSLLALLLAALFVRRPFGTRPAISTSSGLLRGAEQDGVRMFKGVRYAQAPIGGLRWHPPMPFASNESLQSTSLGPSCIQQFMGNGPFFEGLFNAPPLQESEDCLFLNVWAPTSGTNLSTVFWIHGGGFTYGSASNLLYDGESLARNHGIIVVTINYRLNVFGFPASPEIPLEKTNLGFLDQELALSWVQQNIAHFGGDPVKVTIMGESAGSWSVSDMVSRHTPDSAPFRGAILLSGALRPAASPLGTGHLTFDAFSADLGCPMDAGPARLQCLRDVPASDIRTALHGPKNPTFMPVVDNVTAFSNTVVRLRSGLTARVPTIIGHTQDDGTIVTAGLLSDPSNLLVFLDIMLPGLFTPDQVQKLYPALSSAEIPAAAARDLLFLCPAHLWTQAAVDGGLKDVYRYAYGPVFDDLQAYPGAGAWHTSELPMIFGTYNATTAEPAERILSQTMQTLIANFVKNPTEPPAPNWERHNPRAPRLAKLAYNGNVAVGDVVEMADSSSFDGPCDLWDRLTGQ
ncbi:unnamed protein product [Mycena citricolor]|uniref:Carboxylic ester hydrolase n=1 Tax=Mycena citricolor TaxID=2018698 RepID=A0AAD2Q2V0_9AGAR|nr:unnamed protein product [Mycena citricolor]